MSEAEAYAKAYQALVGKTVKRVVKTFEDDCVGLDFGDGLIAWVQSDPEGNGMGFLAIEQEGKTVRP